MIYEPGKAHAEWARQAFAEQYARVQREVDEVVAYLESQADWLTYQEVADHFDRSWAWALGRVLVAEQQADVAVDRRRRPALVGAVSAVEWDPVRTMPVGGNYR